MARKVLPYTVSAPGRDHGKVFVLTEMPATQAEKFAMRAFLAMSRSGMEIPDDVQGLGLAGLAMLGLNAIAGMQFGEAEPLMDEMMACVKLQYDPKHPEATRALIADDVEEVGTLLAIRKELLTLHTGFSFPAAKSTSASA